MVNRLLGSFESGRKVSDKLKKKPPRSHLSLASLWHRPGAPSWLASCCPGGVWGGWQEGFGVAVRGPGPAKHFDLFYSPLPSVISLHIMDFNSTERSSFCKSLGRAMYLHLYVNLH